MTITSTIMTRAIDKGKALKISDELVKGFYARIGKSGRVDFIFRYSSSITGKETTYVIGDYGKKEGGLSISEARKLAKEVRKKVNLGQDPHLDKNKQKKKRALLASAYKSDATTIAILAKRYLAYSKINNALATYTEKKLALSRLSDAYGEYELPNLKRVDAINLSNDIAEKFSNTSAIKLIQHCSAFWNYILEEGILEAPNVWFNMKRQKKQFRAKPRTRWLDDADLKEFVESKLGELKENALRATITCFYTGCRQGMATSVKVTENGRQKLIGFDWSEIKWDRREWVIDNAQRMKARNVQIIPLSDQFYYLLYSWWVADGKPDKGPIVKAEQNPAKYMSGTAFSKVFSKNDYAPHDFRRTANTQLQIMGCPSDVRDKILSHVDRSGVAMSYDMHDYLPERKEWLQQWADHLDTLGFADVVLEARQDTSNISLVK